MIVSSTSVHSGNMISHSADKHTVEHTPDRVSCLLVQV
jgi:hypothetical protein